MAKTSYRATEESRKKVKMMAGWGLRQEQICLLTGLRSAKTLRRYYAKELALGIAESSASIRQTAFKLACSGRDSAMTIFFLKTKARWSPGMTINPETEREEQMIYIYEDYKPPEGSSAVIDGPSDD